MYTIETSFISNGSLIDTVSVLSANETTVENLPSCIEINATLTATFISNGFTQTAVIEYATNETGEFYSSEPIFLCTLIWAVSATVHAVLLFINILSPSAIPIPILMSDSKENCVSSLSNVTLQCSWNSSSYYVGWYKDGSLIYSEDLSVPSVLTPASEGLTVVSDYNDRSSNLTILSSSVADGGNYTCVVSCGARGVEFSNISSTLMDTVQVLVISECYLSAL